MNVDQPKSQHLPELQALRGYAAVVVLFGHATEAYATPGWFHQISLIFNGRMAVVLFFTLSGFVLTRSLRSFEGRLSQLAPFWVRRLARIYPAIWALSLMTLAYIFILRRNVAPPPLMSDYFYSRFNADRMTPLNISASFLGLTTYLIPQSWSISVEIIASMALPFIAFLAYRDRNWFYLLAVFFLFISFAVGANSYFAVLLYIFDFFLGAWAATLEPRLQKSFNRLSPNAIYIVAALCVTSLFTQFLPFSYYSAKAALLEGVLSTTIICLIAYGNIKSKLLTSKASIWLGDISYSIYLLHYLVLSIGAYVLGGLATSFGWTIGPVQASIYLAVFTLAITLLLAPVIYRGVETPGIRAGKWLAARLSGSLRGGSGISAQADLQARTPPP